MNPTTTPSRNPRLVRSATPQTDSLKLTLAGRQSTTSGEWLLREFAKANERGNGFEALTKKRSWWGFW